MGYVFIGVCVSLMVIGHPDDLPHCHTGWEWMCILPDDLHHLHMIFIIAEMYPAIIFTCGGFAPWWWWAASWGCGWTGGREARSNQLINTSSSYHQLIIIQSSLSHHHLVVGGHQEGRQGQTIATIILVSSR